MKKALLLVALAVLGACSTKDNVLRNGDVIMANDFESLVGWVPDASLLSKEHAHSGVYALKVDGSREFSLTYDAVLGEVTARKPRGVRLQAWAYMSGGQSGGKLALVVAAPGAERPIVDEGIELSEQVNEQKKWVQVSKDIVFPPSIQPDSHLRLFLWRSSASDPVYVDDVTITALD